MVLLCIALMGCMLVGKSDGDKMSVDALNQDFQFLRSRVLDIHPAPFLNQDEEAENRLFAQLAAQLTQPLDTTQFYKIVAQYTTSLQDGHTFPSMAFATRQYQASLKKDNTVLPIEVDFKAGYFYIKNVYASPGKGMVGARLLAINNITAEEIISAFQTYYAKKASRFDNAHARLFRAYFWLAFGSFTKWEITYQSDDADPITEALQGITETTLAERQKAATGEMPAMQPAYTFEYIDEKRIGLLTVNRMGNLEAFQQLLDRLFADLDENKTPHLVIDMRQNGGGSSMLGDALYAYLSDQPYDAGRMYVKISEPIRDWYIRDRPNHPLHDFVTGEEIGQLVLYPDTSKSIPATVKHPFAGKSYLLTSAKTYSSGHMFAGLFKCNQIGPMIGQETGQATKTVGDAFTFQLPNSKIDISVSYKVFEGTCEPSYENGFMPDYEVSYSADELASGVDKEMKVVMRLVGKEGG